MQTITTSHGVKIAYSIEGNGPWLTLSHSLASNMDMWNPQMSILTEHFKVLRFDTRGHGHSSAPMGPYSLDDLAQDVVDLFNALGIKQTHWIGLSMGGMIGQTLILQHPHLFSSLVLADTTSKRPENAKAMWGARIAQARTRGMPAMVESTLERWFCADFRELHPEIIQEITHGIETTSLNGFCGCCEAIATIDTFNRLKEISCPTLILVGEQDHGTPPEMAHAMKAQMPKASFQAIPNAGHISNVEQPKVFNQHLIDFYTQAALI